MASTNITLSDDNLVAEYVPLDTFKGVLEQRLGISPDTLALLIRDGKIVEASHGAHISIGGLWQGIKNAIGGSHALRLLIADLKPFPVTAAVKALTQDKVPVQGEVTFEFQVNPEKPANILGLMKDHSAVNKIDVLTRLWPHLGDRVVESVVGRVAALELRGNTALQDKVQAEVMKEVERLVGDLGLQVRAVSLRWAFHEDEIAAIQKRLKEREQEALEQDFNILSREIEREAQSTVLGLKTDLDVEKVKTASEAELRRMVLDQELSFIDARETGVRLEQMKVLQHELEMNKAERLDRLKQELEVSQHQVDLVRSRGDRRGSEREIESADKKHEFELARIHAEMRNVARSTEELDHKHGLTMRRLEEFQKLEIAGKAHDEQVRTMRGLQDVDLEGQKRVLDMDILGQDSAHRRRIEDARRGDETELSKIRTMKDMSPEQILAVNAGLSAAVANVLVEQARAKGGDNAEKMALMREMVEAAKEARIGSEAQARHFFEHGMRGATGVAAGVGVAVGIAAGRGEEVPAALGGTTECAACHRQIPLSDRFCRYCGRQTRV